VLHPPGHSTTLSVHESQQLRGTLRGAERQAELDT